jgi:tetratricopeptide (TPR) repeat protein/transcriptional regulator with XRE-family HTH domain
MVTAREPTFAQLLRQHRKVSGISQEELARRALMSRRGISDLERGASQAPRGDTLAMLADALDLSDAERARFQAAARRGRRPTPTPRASAPATRRSTPFVGRHEELAQIVRFLAGEGPPLLLLAGEPGIGKSRLLREAAARAVADGWTVLEAGCSPSSAREPYAPVIEALARHCAAQPATQLRERLRGCAWLPRLLPELAERGVAPLPQWTLPPEQERRLMFAAVGRYLTNIAGPSGTLLILDDAQWMGGDALDLLASLLQPDASRLAVVVAYRSTEVDERHPLETLLSDLARQGRSERLPIGPLTQPEAMELLAHLLELDQTPESDTISAVERERLLRRTGGVPLFLVSCASAIRSGVSLTERPDQAPWSVRQQIRQRVVALPDPAQLLLGLAAVAGRRVARRQLRAAATGASMSAQVQLDSIEAICHAGLMIEDVWNGVEGYRFAHDLIHEATLAELSVARLRAWNLLHAEAIAAWPEREREQHVSDLARHFLESDETWRALPYVIRVGDQAESAYAHHDAEQRYRTALDLARASDDRSSEALSLERLTQSLMNQARFDEAIESADLAGALYQALDDDEGLLRTLYWYGTSFIVKAAPDRGLERLDALRDHFARRAPSPALAHYLATLAQLYFQAGRAQDALDMAERAVANAQETNDLEALTHAMYMRAMALLDTDQVGGQFEQAMEAVIPLAEQVGDLTNLVFAYNHTGAAKLVHGDALHASERLSRALDLADLLGDTNMRCGLHSNLGLLGFLTGDWNRADAEFSQAMTLYRQIGPAVWSIRAPSELASLRWAQGQRDEALHLIEEVSVSSKTLYANLRGSLAREMVALEAEAQLASGEAESALGQLEHLFDIPETLREMSAPLLAWAYAATGQETRARETLETILEYARRNRDVLLASDAWRVAAILAMRMQRWSEAEGLLDKSIAESRKLPYVYAEAKSLWVYGSLHAVRGELDRGQKCYQAALAILTKLGERPYARLIEQTLAAW